MELTRRLSFKEETVEVKEDQILQMKKEHDASLLDVHEETQEQDQVKKRLFSISTKKFLCLRFYKAFLFSSK